MYRLLFLIGLAACQQGSKISDSGLRIATDEYIVLAQKALTYQADGDWEAWADMLADSVMYYAPDYAQPLKGKAAVLAHCQAAAARRPLESVNLERLLHIPVQRSTPKSEAGVYVVSLFRAKCRYADGRRSALRFNVCCHFDADKRIDRLEAYQSPLSVNTSK